MKIFVTAKPNAKENSVEKLDETHFKVKVKCAPQDGKANQAVIETLADYLDISKSCLTLLKGQTSKNKILELTRFSH